MSENRYNSAALMAPNTVARRTLNQELAAAIKTTIPLLLISGGLLVLYLRYSGWSVVVGIPMVTVGTALAVLTYDDIVNSSVKPIKEVYVPCVLCGKITPRLRGVENDEMLCPRCFKKIYKDLITDSSE